MNLVLKEVSEDEFEKTDCPILFDNAPYNRMFGILTNKRNCFRLAWRSELIKPDVLEVYPGIISIGIDQNYAIANLNDATIPINLYLSSYFLTQKLYRNRLLVITQLEIVIIDMTSLEILDEYDLPDLFEDIEYNDNELIIRCWGRDITIKYDLNCET